MQTLMDCCNFHYPAVYKYSNQPMHLFQHCDTFTEVKYLIIPSNSNYNMHDSPVINSASPSLKIIVFSNKLITYSYFSISFRSKIFNFSKTISTTSKMHCHQAQKEASSISLGETSLHIDQNNFCSNSAPTVEELLSISAVIVPLLLF